MPNERFFFRCDLEFDESEAELDPDTEGDFGCVMGKVEDAINSVPGIRMSWSNIDPADQIV